MTLYLWSISFVIDTVKTDYLSVLLEGKFQCN